MKNNLLASGLLTATSLMAAGTIAAQSGAKEKPNVLFLFVDDMGYECIGAY